MYHLTIDNSVLIELCWRKLCLLHYTGTLTQALNWAEQVPPLGRCFHGSVRVKESD